MPISLPRTGVCYELKFIRDKKKSRSRRFPAFVPHRPARQDGWKKEGLLGFIIRPSPHMPELPSNKGDDQGKQERADIADDGKHMAGRNDDT